MAKEEDDKPRYKVAPGCKFFDGMRMRLGEGLEGYDPDEAEVVYHFDPGENLVPLNAAARRAKERSGKVQRGTPLTADERSELEALRAYKAEQETA